VEVTRSCCCSNRVPTAVWIQTWRKTALFWKNSSSRL